MRTHRLCPGLWPVQYDALRQAPDGSDVYLRAQPLRRLQDHVRDREDTLYEGEHGGSSGRTGNSEKMKKIVILINDTTYAYNLRGAIIQRLIEANYDVVIVGQLLEHQEKLKKMGARLIGVHTGRHGKNPFADLSLLLQYRRILKNENPDVVLTYNIKPNVYGGMACQNLHIHYLPNVTGLGTPVEIPGLMQKLTIRLYKIGVAGADCVFFQNTDNLKFFKKHGMLKQEAHTRVLPGSGVDLEKYKLLPWHDGKVHFLFVARVMKEKGIDLFLAAAHQFASNDVIFDICGACDDPKYLQILKNDPKVVYHGPQKDLRSYYEKCSCFLYPSYYPEGMSNVLLEAAASGRPVIAANRPGCRETLDDGITGFLIPIKDENAVIQAVKKFLLLNSEQQEKMGLFGREKIVREFDRKIVVEAYMDEIAKADSGENRE